MRTLFDYGVERGRAQAWQDVRHRRIRTLSHQPCPTTSSED